MCLSSKLFLADNPCPHNSGFSMKERARAFAHLEEYRRTHAQTYTATNPYILAPVSQTRGKNRMWVPYSPCDSVTPCLKFPCVLFTTLRCDKGLSRVKSLCIVYRRCLLSSTDKSGMVGRHLEDTSFPFAYVIGYMFVASSKESCSNRVYPSATGNFPEGPVESND